MDHCEQLMALSSMPYLEVEEDASEIVMAESVQSINESDDGSEE